MEPPYIRYQGLEKRIPRRAIQTFFRTNYQNHVQLSAIADNKAHIMISVNSILISMLISLTFKDAATSAPKTLLPIVIFLVTGLASLIFAVLSARPKVTNVNGSKPNMIAAKRNMLFFGNFVSMDIEQYEEAMDEVLHNSELLYGNLTRDMYHLGKVLDKKYRYLTVSYNIFMVGFISTVISFLAIILTN